MWREDRLTGRKDIVRHPKGSFVFRLSGRDRQRSASYYTPELLTKCVVKHALAELITDDTKAQDILEYRICEPALGSGAFLNEAINQLAAEYLRRRQDEMQTPIKPEDYTTELQKVKAYLALHRAYGVDLNSTAVELAEVSLWLNVMHSGLQAPWFGLHLRRGNSLIGARRASYDLTSLGRAKKSWLKTPPTDRPLSEGSIGDGEIHHFLLPAEGWAAVADAKQAKELAPEAATALREWRKSVTKKPNQKQTDRLKALATRVERLWALVLRRLEISEQQVSRQIDVWGADLPVVEGAVDRERVERELHDPEGPYERLRLAMDAWCALWFWPVTGSVADNEQGHPGPPGLDEWIVTLEELLGAAGIKKVEAGQSSFQDLAEGFEELAQIDDQDRQFSGMRTIPDLLLRHQWLGTAREIAQDQGFFHWELDFAQIFQRGGFDLQVGNPPWVRPVWNDDLALAESDPYFVLEEKVPDSVFAARRRKHLEFPAFRSRYLSDLASWAGTASVLGSAIEHPVLSGVQTNLYTNFMERVWLTVSSRGVSALLHPEGHFSDPKAGLLREEAYKRLRRHWQFVNELMYFEDIGHPVTYGVHVYGRPGDIHFKQIAQLLDPSTIDVSLESDSAFGGEIPGIQFPWGGWDIRPHNARVADVTRDVLGEWASLFDPPGTPAQRARLLRPLTRQHIEILERISTQPVRLADMGYRWTSCWHEKGAKSDGLIEWDTRYQGSWDEVIYQGPHFTVGTPFAKEPNENCRSKGDYTTWDLESLPESVIPRTNYQRACDRDTYDAGIPKWGDRPATDYWRVAWRRMTQPGSERSLHAALVPPGVAHVNTVNSLTVCTCASTCKQLSSPDGLSDVRRTGLVAGLWASLPFDYLVKVSGKSDVQAELVDRFPAPVDHPAAARLLLRTLRLNCLTRDYEPLWVALYEHGFATDAWTAPFAGQLKPLGVSEPEWSMDTPLRTDFERRAALVEIDALSALMLGLTAEHLALMFRAQFPVLRKYEYEMYFDANGRKIAKDHHAQGVHQQKEDYKLLQEGLVTGNFDDLAGRYTPFAPDAEHAKPWFYKPDREAEMRAAYAEFEQRLADG